MQAYSLDIDLDQAEDFGLNITLKASGIPVDLTGATGRAAVRNASSGAVLAPMALTFDADRASGKLSLSLPATDIKIKLPATGYRNYTAYTWDVRLTIGGRRIKAISGRASVHFGGDDE